MAILGRLLEEGPLGPAGANLQTGRCLLSSLSLCPCLHSPLSSGGHHCKGLFWNHVPPLPRNYLKRQERTWLCTNTLWGPL